MKRTLLVALVSAASVCLLGRSAPADTTFMNINFDNDTTGQSPAVSSSTALPVTHPDALGGYDYDLDPNNGNYESPPTAADGTIVVGNATGITKGAILTTNSADNQIGALWMDTGYNVKAQTLKLSFDLNVLSGSTTTGQSGTLSTDSSTADVLFGVNTFDHAGTGPTLRFDAIATSATTGIYAIRTVVGTNSILTPLFSYTDGDEHDIELDANYVTGTLNVLVDGVSELSDFAFTTTPDANATLTESFFYLNGDTTGSNSNEVAVDNIVGSAAVPLPASAWSGLALLGGLGLLGGVKRMRRGIA